MTAAEFSVWATFAATAVTAIATGVLAWVTWLLFQATKRMAAATTEPNVVATIEPSHWSFIHLDLVIENCGTGPAYEVQLTFEPPLMRDRHSKTNTLPLNTISVLRPSQSLRNSIGSAAGLLQSTFDVKITWKTSPKSKTTSEIRYKISMDQYEGLVQLGDGDPLVSLAQESKKIRENFERIVRDSRRISIDIFDHHDRDKERSEQEEWLRTHTKPKETKRRTKTVK